MQEMIAKYRASEDKLKVHKKYKNMNKQNQDAKDALDPDLIEQKRNQFLEERNDANSKKIENMISSEEGRIRTMVGRIDRLGKRRCDCGQFFDMSFLF